MAKRTRPRKRCKVFEVGVYKPYATLAPKHTFSKLWFYSQDHRNRFQEPWYAGSASAVVYLR